jgi:hypothetical protein
MDMLLEFLLLVHDFVPMMLLLVLLMLFPWEILIIFLMIALVLFLELIFHSIFLRGDSNTSFLNQILHLADPHDKLSTLVLYPSLRFLSIYRLTLWDPRLRYLSL